MNSLVWLSAKLCFHETQRAHELHQISKLQLTKWRFCWGTSWRPEVQAAPLCCSWSFSPPPGRRAPWRAPPSSCSHWWRPAGRDRPGTVWYGRRTAGAASAPHAPAAEGCQRRAQTSFARFSPQLRHPPPVIPYLHHEALWCEEGKQTTTTAKTHTGFEWITLGEPPRVNSAHPSSVLPSWKPERTTSLTPKGK